MISLSLLEISYLIASVTFIFGLKSMGNPKTARNGNLIGAAGMGIAILATILLHDGEVKPMSNTQRYKQCGNAVTVDVVEAVAKQCIGLL